MPFRRKNTALAKAFVTPPKGIPRTTKHQAPKSTVVTTSSDLEVALSTSSDDFTSKLDSLEDLSLPNLPLR